MGGELGRCGEGCHCPLLWDPTCPCYRRFPDPPSAFIPTGARPGTGISCDHTYITPRGIKKAMKTLNGWIPTKSIQSNLKIPQTWPRRKLGQVTSSLLYIIFHPSFEALCLLWTQECNILVIKLGELASNIARPVVWPMRTKLGRGRLSKAHACCMKSLPYNDNDNDNACANQIFSKNLKIYAQVNDGLCVKTICWDCTLVYFNLQWSITNNDIDNNSNYDNAVKDMPLHLWRAHHREQLRQRGKAISRDAPSSRKGTELQCVLWRPLIKFGCLEHLLWTCSSRFDILLSSLFSFRFWLHLAFSIFKRDHIMQGKPKCCPVLKRGIKCLTMLLKSA